ncbi:MAG: redoxin domain-containing protein [Bacteroidetes bacterium]|nr:redoxin domain-containing protein [Bacteroidota bacterium]
MSLSFCFTSRSFFKNIFTVGLLFLTFQGNIFAQDGKPQFPAPNKEQLNYRKKGARIPPFVLEKTLGGTFTNINLKPNKPVMLMIFHPLCEHCSYTFDSLRKYKSQFKNTQLVMVAEDRNKDYMKGFIKKMNLKNEPLFQNIGTEKGNLIYYLYTYEVLPQVNFYDKNYKLIQTFTGRSPFDSLKMFIQ